MYNSDGYTWLFIPTGKQGRGAWSDSYPSLNLCAPYSLLEKLQLIERWNALGGVYWKYWL